MISPGQRFRHFRIDGFIGSGGFGAVWRGTDLRNGLDVALKIVHKDDCPGELPARFFRECRILAALSHPRIVAIFDFGEEEGHLYYSMEFVGGESLDQLMRRVGLLPVPQMLGLVKGILYGLDYLHGRGILHRDLKPANVLLRDGLEPVLIDFGLVRVEAGAGLTLPGETVGTPRYMAPEVALGKRADRRADLYQIGILMFLMLTGTSPYTPEEVFKMMSGQKVDPPDLTGRLSGVASKELCSYVIKAVQPDPEARFQSAKEMIEEMPRVAAP